MTHEQVEELADWTLEDLQESMIKDPLRTIETIKELAERCLQAESDVDEIAGGCNPCCFCEYNKVDLNAENSETVLERCNHCIASSCHIDFVWQGTHDMMTMEDALKNG